jgi:hypothetical protein
VAYDSTTAVGTSSSWANSFQSQTTLSTSFSGKIFLFGGSTISQAWTETKENTGSVTINKTTTNGLSVPGPGDSNAGIDHNADIIGLWINPETDFKVTSPTAAQWNFSFDQRDPANAVDVQYVYVAWLKNPALMPPGVQQALSRTWAGPGQGLTTDDYAAILQRDPFANGNTTVDSRRFDLQAGQTFTYLPPPCGYQPFTQSYSNAYNTTTAYGQTATDSYQVGYTKTTQQGFGDWLQVNFTSGLNLTWTNGWGHQNSSANGQSATFHITGPSDCNYSGPTSVQVYQDNVYGTFMFKFL